MLESDGQVHASSFRSVAASCTRFEPQTRSPMAGRAYWRHQLLAKSAIAASPGRLVAMRRPTVFVVAKGQRPHPRRPDWRGVYLEDAADNITVGRHIVIVITPLTGRSACRGMLEDQIVLVHFTEPTCAASLDHLVGGGEQRLGHVEAEHPRGLSVDDQFEFGRLHNRQVHGLGTLEDAASIDAGLTPSILKV